MSDFKTDFARGRWDVPFFAKRFLGIRLHPGQVRMAKAYLQRDKTRWRALYLWLMVAAGNRAGKTMALAVIIIHACVYKMGLEPPSDINDQARVNRWLRLPFHWWHFAIEQGPAEQVFTEITQMLAGNHPAQKDGCPWAEEVGGAANIAKTDQKERSEYAWIQFAPIYGGAEVHFRSTKQKALGSLGQNMHGVSFDEAGLETNLDFLMSEVLHLRRLGTGGPFILISTPSAATSTDFEDLWYTGDPDDPFRVKRRFSMRMSSRDNIGFGLDQDVFDSLIEGMDENIIRQNIDGEFIQASTAWFNSGSVDGAFSDALPEHVDPRRGRVYVHALDPGLKDKMWSMVFDVAHDRTAVGVHLERIVGKQTTPKIVTLGKRVHHAYAQGGKAYVETGVDTTALGGHMFRDLLEGDEIGGPGIPIKSVEFGGVTKVKRQLLSDLRSALDEGKLKMPAEGFWGEVRRQLRNYKLLDRKIEQDLVMALAIVVKLVRQAPAQAKVEATPFDYLATGEVRDEHDDGINPRTIRARMRERDRIRLAALTADPGA